MKIARMFALCGLIAIAQFSESRSAYAVAPFKKEFEAKYVKENPNSDPERTLVAAVTQAKCNVCHFGKSKKNHNVYGKALAALLTKKDAKDKEKIISALEQVAAMKSNPQDASSPTFGQLIEQGKLPGGQSNETATASAGE